MNTTESKKKYDDSMVDSYLEEHNIYESADLGIDIAAVIKYAREHKIALAEVPQEIVEQYTNAPAQKVG